MTDHRLHEGQEHPDDELVELALGDVGEPDRSRLIHHLAGCPRCRAHYEDLVDAVDTILPATPSVAPPVGFEQRTLNAMGISERFAPERRRRGREARVRILVAAAVAVVAALVGGAAAVAIWDDDGVGPVQLASDTSPLRTSDGAIVGFAAVSSFDDRPALIVSVSGQGAKGVGYTCRILYADGRAVMVGHPWILDEPGGSTWIESTPEGRIVGMELVDDDGRVWATTNLR